MNFNRNSGPSDPESDDTAADEESPASVRLRAARKTRAASGLVAILFLSAFGSFAFSFAAERHPLAIQGIFLMAFLGVVLLMMKPAGRLQAASEFRILRYYKSPRFYGIVITISSGLVMIYAFVTTPATSVRARAYSQPLQPAPAPAPPKALAFPPLELAGVILGGHRSSALINGRTLFIGEYIDAVKLVEVREDEVVVELQGFRKAIPRNSYRVPSIAAPLR